MRRLALTVASLALLAACERKILLTESQTLRPDAGRPRPRVENATPADLMATRHVVTFYRWQSTEAGNAETNNESIEHGAPMMHFVFEVHRTAENKGYVNVSVLRGDTAIPRSNRMRALSPPAATWDVPRDGYTRYELEQCGGVLRPGEPIRVLLGSNAAQRLDVAMTATPTFTRLPQGTALFPAIAGSLAGKFDDHVVLIVPMNASRGGRYMIYALDLAVEAGGFGADGMMTHNPSDAEIARYLHWMRDPTGMARDRNPPNGMRPIERR